MRGRPASLMALLAAAACTACASGGPRERVTPIRLENVFLSPSGEPFRGDRDAPYAIALWFARADLDHDGRITRAEFAADAVRAFHRYDTNGDGVVDGLEIAAYEDKIAPEIQPRIAALSAGEGMDGALFGGRGGGSERPERPSGRSRAGDRAQQGAGFYGLLDEPEPLSAADADLDGKVTLAEWLKRTDSRFTILADGADALTLAALPKTGMQRLIQKRDAALAKDRGRR